MRLLIDECLSEELAKLARDRCHPEASHVRWIGKGGAKDWELIPVILAGDWTFVTKNSIDFRGPVSAPGSDGEYATLDLHAGLICLNGPVGMDLDMQLELMEVALDDLDAQPDLVNQVLELHVMPYWRNRPIDSIKHTYIPEKRRALDVWADYLKSIVAPEDGGNVVKLRG